MGSVDKFFELKSGMEAVIPAGVIICADAEELAALKECDSEQLANATMFELVANKPLPLTEMAKDAIVVLQVDPGDDASAQRLIDLRQRMPDMPVIVALRESSLSVVRTLLKRGVSDVVSLPFDVRELTESLLEVATQTRSGEIPVRGELIGVIRGSGGIGATTVLTHLAAAMGDIIEDPKRVCLIDLDIQSGDAASYLRLTPSTGVMDLFDAGTRVDADVLRGAAVDSGNGFRLVAAPPSIEPLENVDIDQLLRVLQLARQEFDHVLIDLPVNWTNWTLSAALACSRVYFLTDQRFASLRQTRRRIDLLKSMDLDRDRIGVVVNREERKLFQAIGTSEIAETLKAEVVATLAADAAGLADAVGEGVTIDKIHPRSRFARDIRALAEDILGVED